MTGICRGGEGGNYLINTEIVDVVGPALGGPAGTGVSPSEGDSEAVYLQMSDGTASEHGEVVAILPSV